MTNPASTVPASAIAAKEAGRAMLGILAMLTVSVGVSLGFVYSQIGQAQFTPTVAKQMVHASDQHRANGDHQAALATSRKATEMYRRLMRLSSAHYAPYLAGSLHLLSVRLSEVGDYAGARAAIDEAIAIRRQLAKFSPARYQAGLEQSLQHKALIEAVVRDDGPTVSIANSAS
jgi:tetratricopeptide (TPR) repeat protein